jgi:hypothetical protein
MRRLRLPGQPQSNGFTCCGANFGRGPDGPRLHFGRLVLLQLIVFHAVVFLHLILLHVVVVLPRMLFRALGLLGIVLLHGIVFHRIVFFHGVLLGGVLFCRILLHRILGEGGEGSIKTHASVQLPKIFFIVSP